MVFSDFYGLGAIMGFAPSAVDQMMLWALAACADGYAKANGAEEVPEAPSFEEHQAMLRRLAG